LALICAGGINQKIFQPIAWLNQTV